MKPEFYDMYLDMDANQKKQKYFYFAFEKIVFFFGKKTTKFSYEKQ